MATLIAWSVNSGKSFCSMLYVYMNMCIQVFVLVYVFNFSGSIPRSGIARLYDNIISNLLRKCQTLYHSGCILHYYQQSIRLPLSPHPCQLIPPIFFIVVILESEKWYFILIFICIYLMSADNKYFFHELIGHLYIFFKAMCIKIIFSF